MAKVCTVAIVYVFVLVALATIKASPVGYSYAKFSGPVSGPEKEILIEDEHDHGHHHVDYIAKPDYQFSYGVDDPKSKVQQNRKEVRHGDTVHGEYSLVEPDGTIRIVKYTADDIHGFQAQVITDGKSSSYGHEEEIPVHEEHNESSYAIEHSTEHEHEHEHEGYGGGEYQEIKEDDEFSGHEVEDSSY